MSEEPKLLRASATVGINLRIGQRVRFPNNHSVERPLVTGLIRGIQLDHDDRLMVLVDLDESIIIPARADVPDDLERRIHSQYVHATEVEPCDLIDELADALRELIDCKDLQDRLEGDAYTSPQEFAQAVVDYSRRQPVAWLRGRLALAKVGT